MNNTNVTIDPQALINKMTVNFANELAVKEQTIANLQVTAETLNQKNQDLEKQLKEYEDADKTKDTKKAGK